MTTPALRIVCLGDSITGGNPAQRYLDKYSKWSDLLQLTLETHLGLGQVEVINRGHAGQTSTESLARVESQVLPHQPHIVIVLLGANNFSPKNDSGSAPAILRDDLIAITSQLKAAGITKILLLQYPEPKADEMSQVWVHANLGNPIIAEVAARETVPTLDLAPAFREAAQSHPLAELASPVDGIHLNPYGEIVLARAVFFKLRDLGWI